MAKQPKQDEAPDDKGNLHLTEEFSRVKRNLLWTCSTALLLGVVQFPADGTAIAPVFGINAHILPNALKAAVWLGCAYNAFGFWRQVRNMDRLNSEAIYTREFGDLKRRLSELATLFDTLIVAAQETVDKLQELNPTNKDTTAFVLQDLAGQVRGSLSSFETAMKQVHDDPPDNIPSTISNRSKSAWQEIERAFQSAGESLVESGTLKGEAGRKAARLFEKGANVATQIELLQGEFNKLSDQIRAEHRRFYWWYDKWLTFGIFAAATVASFWYTLRLPDLWHRLVG